MIQAIESVSTLAITAPMGLLVGLLVFAVVYQSSRLRAEREVNQLLVRELWAVRNVPGVALSAKAEDTLSGRNRRHRDSHHEPERRVK